MSVKRGVQGFSTPPGLTRASRRHFPLQPICAGRKEVLTIVVRFTFLVDLRRVATKRIIEINLPDETICTALRLRDERYIGFAASSRCSYI